MEDVTTLDEPPESGVSSSRHVADSSSSSAPVSVTVRYWAAIKAAAGTGIDEVSGSTVAQVVAAARELHADSPRFAEVLSVCTLLLGDRPLGTADLREVPVAAGDVLDVLPPFAGG